MARRGNTLEIYKRVREGPGKGVKVATAAAFHVESRAAVDFYANALGREASAILARHHHQGHAEIKVEPGSSAKKAKRKYVDIERVVVLSDTRGFGAAMTIEFGMGPGIDDEGYFYPGTEAVAPLRRAAGLPWVKHRTGNPVHRLPNRRSRRWKL